jgi:hypothetical protein
MADQELPTDPSSDPQVRGGDADATPDAEAGKARGRDEGSGSGGQVSESSMMDPAQADVPISDGQSVAGQPDGESGAVDEGPQGPNARTGSDLPDGPVADRADVTGE